MFGFSGAGGAAFFVASASEAVLDEAFAGSAVSLRFEQAAARIATSSIESHRIVDVTSGNRAFGSCGRGRLVMMPRA